MKRAVYPGTFDPITYGHLDIIKRAAAITDELVVGVLVNSNKSPTFTVDERVAMIESVITDIPNVKVKAFEGLLVDFARQENAYVIKGLRAVTDYEYELQMAQANRTIAPEVDTVFITASLEYAYLCSSIVREVASYHGDISKFVPDNIGKLLLDKYK
ncbi:MAG: pantetheine-phosphate adenylyltransferase [Lachnospiraceae bacterium]|jgi:pantetheine-phosphate adenylyltransferase